MKAQLHRKRSNRAAGKETVRMKSTSFARLHSLSPGKIAKSRRPSRKLRVSLRGRSADDWARRFARHDHYEQKGHVDHMQGVQIEQPSSCRLLALPRKLRDRISGYVFSTGLARGAAVALVDAEKPLLTAGRTFLQTCKQIHNEGRLAFWIECRRYWQFTNFTAHFYENVPSSAVKSALRRISRDNLNQMEHVSIDLFSVNDVLCRMTLVKGVWWLIFADSEEQDGDEEITETFWLSRQEPVRAQGVRKAWYKIKRGHLGYWYLHESDAVQARVQEPVTRADQIRAVVYWQSDRHWN